MPDQPLWFAKLNSAIQTLEALPDLWIDRPVLEFVLGVGRRRAQQILQPLVTKRIGSSGLAAKETLIAYLQNCAQGEAARFETQRREKLQRILQEAQAQPRVLVETPLSILEQQVETLPPGIHLAPGRIVVEGFTTAEEALEKLLALGIAAGNNLTAFEERILSGSTTKNLAYPHKS